VAVAAYLSRYLGQPRLRTGSELKMVSWLDSTVPPVTSRGWLSRGPSVVPSITEPQQAQPEPASNQA